MSMLPNNLLLGFRNHYSDLEQTSKINQLASEKSCETTACLRTRHKRNF